MKTGGRKNHEEGSGAQKYDKNAKVISWNNSVLVV